MSSSATLPPPTPVGIRRPSQEIDTLRAEIGGLTSNLRHLSEELVTARKERAADKEGGLSVTKLHVPFLMVFAIVGLLVGVGTTASIFVGSTRAHISNDKIHVDDGAAKVRGGVAYSKDLADAISDLQAHDRAALRAIVKNSPIVCTPLKPGDVGYGRGKSGCTIGDPEIRQ
jgi:hypothetical protein